MTLPVVDVFGINIVLFGVDLIAFIGLYLGLTTSLNLEFGFTGIPNFGKLFFVALGGSVGGALAGRFATWIFGLGSQADFIKNNNNIIPQATTILQGNPLLSMSILLVVVAMVAVVGAAFGAITSYAAIRLRSDYLAITLFSFAEIYIVFLNNYTPLVGGSLGIFVPDPYAWAGDYRFVLATITMVIFGLLVYVYAERLVRSPLGRVLRSIRDNETAASAFGKDIVSYRRKTLMVASAISAVAGALFSFYTVDVYSLSYQRTLWTVYPWVMMTLGGAGNNFGVALGVVIFWVVLKITDTAKFAFGQYIPFDVTWLQYFFIAAIFLGMLFFRPEGLIKEKSSATLSKRGILGIVEREFGKILKKNEKDGTPKAEDGAT
jgi:branched-chain amino acid transport system permease protein